MFELGRYDCRGTWLCLSWDDMIVGGPSYIRDPFPDVPLQPGDRSRHLHQEACHCDLLHGQIYQNLEL